MSGDCLKVLNSAEREAEKLKDQYISTEHIFLSIIEGQGEASRILGNYQIRRDDVLKALQSIRGNQRVTDQSPESTYQVLEKYCRD